MVYKEVLFGALPDGTDLHCLFGPPVSHLHAWSADGTAILSEATPQASLLTGDAQSYAYASPTDGPQALTRPQATGVYIVTGDGSIDQFTFVGTSRIQIATGIGAKDVAVSPDGATLAVTSANSSRTGVVLMNNDGSNQRELVTVPTVASGNQTSFAGLGPLVWLSATSVAYLQAPPGTKSGPFALNVVDTTTGKVLSTAVVGADIHQGASTALVADGAMVATEFGSCSSQIAPTVYDTSGPTPTGIKVPVPTAYSFAAPIGWLPDHTLVMLAKASSCAGPGDVLLWKMGSAATQLYASGATEAAVRAPGSVFEPGALSSGS